MDRRTDAVEYRLKIKMKRDSRQSDRRYPYAAWRHIYCCKPLVVSFFPKA
jgi:hypothetical protein